MELKQTVWKNSGKTKWSQERKYLFRPYINQTCFCPGDVCLAMSRSAKNNSKLNDISFTNQK
jgi:hypothetical protein